MQTERDFVVGGMNKIITLPNILTGLRFALVPVLIILFSIKQTFTVEMVSFGVFGFAALTDLADGWFARKYKLETVFGKLMDPLADKILVCTALVMLVPLDRMPAWVCVLIICQEMIATGFRGFAASKGKVVAADSLGKYKSNFQYFGLAFLIFPIDVFNPSYQHEIGMVFIFISLVLAAWSAIEYFYKLGSILFETSK